MDLKQLEYFVRVAELGSFTRASIALDIAQPALSRQVRLLEVELRQNLLIRNGRGVTTTEAGRMLLEHARGILHQVERTREELDRVRGGLTGRVALGLPPSLSKVLAVPLIGACRTALPEAKLSIIEGLTATMQELLVAGRLDIALLYNPTPSPDIDANLLLEEDLFLIEPKKGSADTTAKPITLRDLAEVPLVIPSRPNAIRTLVEVEMANIGCRPTIALEIDGVAAILDLVADGAGCAVLSANAARALGKPATFVARPIRPRLRSKLMLAISSRRPTTLTQQSVMAVVRQRAQLALVPSTAANEAKRAARNKHPTKVEPTR
jgi:LysR family transcriptional regulator, nitrogen assimilation regulatory protein